MGENSNQISVNRCAVCKQSAKSPLYGKFAELNNIYVHHFCLLFSQGLAQNGKDDEGFEGFLYEDILAYRDNVKNFHPCTYCDDPTATVRCIRKGCKNYFHVICGRNNECRFNCNKMTAFCRKHNSAPVKQPKKYDPKLGCLICQKRMGDYHPLKTILLPCCKDQSAIYFHDICIAKQALHAGYDFSCIRCKSKDLRKYVGTLGIFVPKRTASWELPGAYSDIEFDKGHCSLDLRCICEKGTNYWDKEGSYSAIECYQCKGEKIHQACCREFFPVKIVTGYLCKVCDKDNYIITDYRRSYVESWIEKVTTQSPEDIKKEVEMTCKSSNILNSDDVIIISDDEENKEIVTAPSKRRKLF